MHRVPYFSLLGEKKVNYFINLEKVILMGDLDVSQLVFNLEIV